MVTEPAPPPVRHDEWPDVPWGLPEGVGGVLLAFVIYIVAGGIFYAAATGLYRHHYLVFEVLSYQLLAAAVAFVALVLIFVRFHVGPAAVGYRFPGWSALSLAALSVIPILIAAAVLAGVFNSLFPGYHLQGNAKQLLPHVPHNPVLDVGIVLWTAVEAPLVEETLFRGILFQGLRHFFARFVPYNVAVAIGAVLSGLAFGIAHFEPHSWPILMFLGIALAYVFQFGRSIYASATVHGVFNAISVLTLFHGG